MLEKLFTRFTEVKRILALHVGQKPPVVSVRRDLIEPFGGFFSLICAFGKRGTLPMCERYEGAHVAAKQNHLLDGQCSAPYSSPGISPPLCPHQPRTRRNTPRLSLGGSASKAEGRCLRRSTLG